MIHARSFAKTFILSVQKCQQNTSSPSGTRVDDKPAFIYQDQRTDLEQAGFIQDLIRFHNWTI
jgi:hypothetical protein